MHTSNHTVTLTVLSSKGW